MWIKENCHWLSSDSMANVMNSLRVATMCGNCRNVHMEVFVKLIYHFLSLEIMKQIQILIGRNQRNIRRVRVQNAATNALRLDIIKHMIGIDIKLKSAIAKREEGQNRSKHRQFCSLTVKLRVSF